MFSNILLIQLWIKFRLSKFNSQTMNSLKKNLCILLFLIMNIVYSQNLDAYKWKNRVLLVLANDIDNTIYIKQIQELKAHESGLKDRKLIVYHVTNEGYKTGFLENFTWKKSTQLYKTYKKDNASFEIVLIGLDGDIKLRKTDFLSCEALFGVIDVMPMRQSELEHN